MRENDCTTFGTSIIYSLKFPPFLNTIQYDVKVLTLGEGLLLLNLVALVLLDGSGIT